MGEGNLSLEYGENKMSLAQFIPSFPTAVIQSDWTTAAHVLADMEASWGIVFNHTLTFIIDVWEGPNDPDDFAEYTISNGVLTVATPFTTQPAAGSRVYILDLYFG